MDVVERLLDRAAILVGGRLVTLETDMAGLRGRYRAALARN
jgi:hypothetical protein